MKRPKHKIPLKCLSAGTIYYPVELTVEAALSGDRQLFIEALLADGGVHDTQVASAMVDDLLKAHKAYLPY